MLSLTKLKYLIVLLALGFFTSACSRCDTSNPTGAADCLCNIMEDAVNSIQNPDHLEDLSEELEEVREEIEEQIDNGSYTEEELEQAIIDRNCMGSQD